MRGHDEVVVARLDLQVEDGHGGQLPARARPAPAAVPAREEAELRPHEQHARALGVLAHDVDGLAPGKVAGDGLPGPAEVVGAEEVRSVVVAAMPVERDVGGALARAAGLHP